MNAREAGERAEQLEAEFVRKQGWEIRDRNWSCLEGELDIVAADGEELIFVEVKGRRSRMYGTPEESVNRSKQRHLCSAAQRYLMDHELEDRSWRIDVIAIMMNAEGSLERLDHYPSAVADESRRSQ